ncbi:UNVERIFIED_CONTAM: hypothetical protein PYX00_008080 [Menopon gallinae]|uniref:Uncharacterized protein n=1 Tax=Menopon gallinae TaxID=328185 RepID=A0AAW2HMA2_9NEOP
MSNQKAKPEVPVLTFRDTKSSTDKVKEDGVMKELFRKEEETRQKWEDQWGFMKNPKKYWVDEANKRGLPAHIFSGRNDRRVPILQSWGEMKTENITIHASPSISQRTSAMVGWRSSIKENDYNTLVGPLYVSPRMTMNPPLSEDEPHPEKQKFIFLG